MVRPQVSLAARLFLDLGGIEQGGNDGGRADAHGNTGLHQLGPALFVGAVVLFAAVAHEQTSMALGAGLEAA